MVHFGMFQKESVIVGKLIVLTGLDGSGTTTVAEQLHFEDAGSSLFKSPPFPFSTNRHDIDEKVYHSSPAAHYLYYLASNVYLEDIIIYFRKMKKIKWQQNKHFAHFLP